VVRLPEFALPRVASLRAAGAGALLLGLAWLACGERAVAQQASPGPSGIYTCTDEKGVRRTSDRVIPECSDREQRVLNRDGSLKQVIPPTLTPDERAAREAAAQRVADQRAAYNDGVRRDRNLLFRYRTEAAHSKAREAALESVRVAMLASEQRIHDLQAEAKPLHEEAEFYRGRKLPARLKQRIDANQTSIAAQRDLIQTQEAEVVRINRIFDGELEHLRKLWNGAAPGSIGPISMAAIPVKTP